MKIGIDVSPLQNSSAVRGIGFYTKRLISALEQYSEHQVMMINSRDELGSVDVVHYPYFDLYFSTLPAQSQQPTVVTIHDVIPLVFPKQFVPGIKGHIRHFFQKRNLQTVKAILTDSESSKRDIQKYLQIPPERIHVVYLCGEEGMSPVTDAKKLAEVKQKYSLPDKFVLKVSDVNYHKNMLRTLEAFVSWPEGQLVLAGKALVADREGKDVTAELAQLLSFIERHKLGDRVYRLGFVPDEEMSSLYSLAHVTLQNSLYEGFGLPHLESMQCGTPVIGGDNSSQVEVLGEAGWLIKAEDLKETIRILKHVWELDSQEYDRQSALALSQAAKFSKEKLARQTSAVYEAVGKM
jgi:glycosyltransferase involved in cell wall biosynthesis